MKVSLVLMGFWVSVVLIVVDEGVVVERDFFFWDWGRGMYDIIMVFMILVCFLMVFFMFWDKL